MSKKRICLDNRQMALDFDQPIEVYTRLREELLQDIEPQPENHEYLYEECCIEVAVAVKKAIRVSGLSREQVCDAVNDYFGWPKDDKRKSLSIHMLNNHICKPSEYPLSAPLIHAIGRVTGSQEPLTALAEMEGARMITGDEVRKLALGKIDDALAELQKLKRTFRTHNK
jgi:hypothetical protein